VDGPKLYPNPRKKQQKRAGPGSRQPPDKGLFGLRNLRMGHLGVPEPFSNGESILPIARNPDHTIQTP